MGRQFKRGTACIQLIHFGVQQKLAKYYKATILQSNFKKKKGEMDTVVAQKKIYTAEEFLLKKKTKKHGLYGLS